MALTVSMAGSGSATPDHRDLLLNREKSVFTAGPFKGDNVTFFGSGTWSMATGQVWASGSFFHRHPNGSLAARAVWVVTGVESFHSFGTIPGTPLEGGVLVLDVKFYPPEGAPFTVNDFTITCVVGSPPPGAEEGVTVASIGLTEPVDQQHRFNLFLQI